MHQSQITASNEDAANDGFGLQEFLLLNKQYMLQNICSCEHNVFLQYVLFLSDLDAGIGVYKVFINKNN